jgi:ABC-2 type transport system permease protein
MSVITRRLSTPLAQADPLRRHVNLTRELATTQFKLKYTGSVLGYLWSLFKPLMLFGITYLIFVYLFKVGRTSPHFPLQLLLGIVLFSFFQEATATAMGSIAGTGHLIRKAYFPRSILVISATLSALITFLINLCLITLIGALLGQMQLSLASLAAPLFLLELYAVVFGLSLLLSALFVFYRDLGHIWEILSQLLLYGSAVIYPFSLVANGHRVLGFLVGINPIAQIIEDMRHALVGGDLPYPADSGLHGTAVPWMVSYLGPLLYLIPLVLVVAVLVVGTVVFRRLSPRFAENL